METLTPKDVEKEWSVLTERKQRDLRAARAIRYHRLGHRTIVYTRKDVENFLASRRVEAFPRKVKN